MTVDIEKWVRQHKFHVAVSVRGQTEAISVHDLRTLLEGKAIVGADEIQSIIKDLEWCSHPNHNSFAARLKAMLNAGREL